MNEEMLFQKMDYTKNPNLVFEENTLYEVDPNCMKHREKESPVTMKADLQEDEPVTNVFFQQQVNKRNKMPGILCWLLVLLLIRS